MKNWPTACTILKRRYCLLSIVILVIFGMQGISESQPKKKWKKPPTTTGQTEQQQSPKKTQIPQTPIPPARPQPSNPHYPNYKISCPKKGCWEVGLISEWLLLSIEGDSATILRLSPGVGYFITDSIEISGSLSYFTLDGKLDVIALPFSVFFYSELDKGIFIFGGPFFGFFHASIGPFSRNGVLFGGLGGIKYNLKKLSKQFYLSVGTQLLYATASGIDMLSLSPAIGFSWIF